MSFIVSDTFARADNPSVLGTANTGHVWTAAGGTWGVIGGSAYCSAFVGYNSTAFLESGISDCEVTCTMVVNPTGADGQRLGIRHTDISNGIVVLSDTGLLKMMRLQAGAYVTIGSVAYTPVNGDVWNVRAVGSQITVRVNNVVVIGPVTETFNQTATKHGLNVRQSVLGRFDNFLVDDLGFVTYALSVLARSPSGYWRLRETSTAQAAVDASGHGQDGSYLGATVTLSVPSLLSFASPDTCMSVVAAGGPGRVSVPASAFLDITGTAISVVIWVKASGQVNFGYLIAHTNGSNTGYALYTGSTGTCKFYFGDGSTAKLSAAITSSIWDGARHMVAATYDGSNIRIYVDGAIDTTTPATGSIASYAAALTIGSLAGVNGVNATLDEPAIFPSVLSAADVLALWLAGTSMSASLAGAAVVTQPVVRMRLISGSLAGTGVLAASATRLRRVAAALVGVAAFAADMAGTVFAFLLSSDAAIGSVTSTDAGIGSVTSTEAAIGSVAVKDVAR